MPTRIRSALLLIAMAACTPAKKEEGPVLEVEPEAPRLTTYVPESATMVLVANPSVLAKSPVAERARTFLLASGMPEFGDVADAARVCGVGVDTWTGLVVAGSLKTAEAITVVRANGIGKKTTIECLAKQLDTVRRWKVSVDEGRVEFDIENEDTRGIAVADDLIIVRNAEYAEEVTALLDGTGKSAEDGAVGRMLAANVDKSRPLYFAAESVPDISNSVLPGLKYAVGSVDLAAGLAVDVNLVFEDAAKADVFAKGATKMLADTRDVFASTFGVPASVLATVTFDAQGDSVVAHGSAKPDELTKMVGELEKHL